MSLVITAPASAGAAAVDRTTAKTERRIVVPQAIKEILGS
jgi:hypothetical protein